MPLEQAAIGGFLGQRMPKDVDGPLGFDALVDEFELAQLAQLIFDRSRPAPYCAQQAQRKFSTDHRGGLEKSFRVVRQPVDARHHDVVDRVRDQEVRSEIACLAGVQRQLLEKKRIALGLRDDFLGYQLNEALRPKHRPDHVQAVVGG